MIKRKQALIQSGLRSLLTACAGALVLCACVKQPLNAVSTFNSGPLFEEVTKAVGLRSEPTWKYGGPSIADLNGDGRYELMLSNHHRVTAQLFWANQDGQYVEHNSPLMKHDVHGIAPGDFDADGDADLLISLGGGNGSKPQPPRLLRNDDGILVDITEQAGIGGMGARGRAVRWIDLDNDGDLDILQINAAVLLSEKIPRNLMFENLGDGQFRYVPNSTFEAIDAERVLITDFDGDHIPDLVCFTPLSLWKGTDKFDFIDVTEAMLPAALHKTEHVMAVADLDIDNDGDLDLYLARGKTYYELANNSVDFDPEQGRIDLRDEGNKSHDGLSFSASGPIQLHDFFRWYRAVEFDPMVFLGKDKIAIPAPVDAITIEPSVAQGFPESITESGWYLGYLGEGQWRLEWRLNDNLAWDIRASISGVSSLSTDWVPQNSDVADLLLVNQPGRFIDASERLPEVHKGNNWGVTTGDFDNDSRTDLFVYRFGGLSKREPDALILNPQDGQLNSLMTHGAYSSEAPESHGDMGAAFDYDLDGRVDILSGDDDQGSWHLYKNVAQSIGQYLLVQVGYSPGGVDSIGAQVWLELDDATQYRHTGSSGATHSQSVLNTVHFGLGDSTSASRVRVRWRDGQEEIFDNVESGQLLKAGKLQPN